MVAKTKLYKICNSMANWEEFDHDGFFEERRMNLCEEQMWKIMVYLLHQVSPYSVKNTRNWIKTLISRNRMEIYKKKKGGHTHIGRSTSGYNLEKMGATQPMWNKKCEIFPQYTNKVLVLLHIKVNFHSQYRTLHSRVNDHIISYPQPSPLTLHILLTKTYPQQGEGYLTPLSFGSSFT